MSDFLALSLEGLVIALVAIVFGLLGYATGANRKNLESIRRELRFIIIMCAVLFVAGLLAGQPVLAALSGGWLAGFAIKCWQSRRHAD